MGGRSHSREAEVRALVVDRPHLEIIAWHTEEIAAERTGAYGRRFWLPLIGPTSFLLAQTLGDALLSTPASEHPVTIPMTRLAELLGVGGSLGPHAPLVRSVGRLGVFRLVVPQNGMLAVRDLWPLLSHAQHRQLPVWLGAEHARVGLHSRDTDESGRSAERRTA